MFTTLQVLIIIVIDQHDFEIYRALIKDEISRARKKNIA